MAGGDMIVSLQHLPGYELEEAVRLKRAFICDRDEILEFIKVNFSKGWIHEAERAIIQNTCFIAVENGKVIGFACYDATAKGFFGPIGVDLSARGRNVGTALLIRTLTAMREAGYAYGIIGWVDGAREFYRKTVGAEYIPGGTPENSVYANMIGL